MNAKGLGCRFCQRLIQIGDQVDGILDPDGYAHDIRGGPRGFLLLSRQLTVRG